MSIEKKYIKLFLKLFVTTQRFLSQEVLCSMKSNNLKVNRILKGFSQRQLAKKVGISQPNISRYEKNLQQPSEEVKQRIADILELPVKDLFINDNQESFNV